MIMKRIFAAVITVVTSVFFVSDAVAEDAFSLFANEKPLAVIRLHTPNMRYENALKRAIKAVLTAKKDATFTLAGGYAEGDDVWKKAAKKHILSLTTALRTEYGVAPEYIHSVINSSADVSRAELRIYVD